MSEQRSYSNAVGAQDYRRWVAGVCRTFSGPAAGRELRSVLPAVEAALRHGQHGMDSGFGDLPLAVLGSRAWGPKWETMQRELATRSRNRVFRPTDDTLHNIHMSHVGLTVEAIRATVQTASRLPEDQVSRRRLWSKAAHTVWEPGSSETTPQSELMSPTILRLRPLRSVRRPWKGTRGWVGT